jgi:hypothetical protein
MYLLGLENNIFYLSFERINLIEDEFSDLFFVLSYYTGKFY